MLDRFQSENWAEKLHVFTVISNPINYRSRYELYKEFAKHMKDSNVVLWTAELAYGEHNYIITEKDNPFHLRLRSGGEDRKGNVVWSKENMINLLIAHARTKMPEIKYVAWIDADVFFYRKNWAIEAVTKLQYFDFIQLFSHAQDLGPNDEPLDKKPDVSFCYAWHNELPMEWDYKKYASGLHHPGYAWAGRLRSLEDMGMLPDFAILGSADRHFAYALVDKVLYSVHPNVHPVYIKLLKQYGVRGRLFIHKNIGYLEGLIAHKFHGAKRNRGYRDRWQILVRNQYNPELDIKKDSQGLYHLTERNWRLRRDIYKYMESRNEDSIDL